MPLEDFIPNSFQGRHNWAKNIHDEIDEHAVALDLDSGDVSAVKAFFAPLVAKYALVLDLQRQLETAIGDANDAFNDASPEMRRMFGEWRKKPNYTDGIGDALDIATSGTKPDPATIKPRITATSYNGFVRIAGRKNYAETVNIYNRLVGQATWTLVIAKRKTLPWDDTRPLTTPGTAERREYMAVGVIGDEEIGLPSDIVETVFGG